MFISRDNFLKKVFWSIIISVLSFSSLHAARKKVPEVTSNRKITDYFPSIPQDSKLNSTVMKGVPSIATQGIKSEPKITIKKPMLGIVNVIAPSTSPIISEGVAVLGVKKEASFHPRNLIQTPPQSIPLKKAVISHPKTPILSTTKSIEPIAVPQAPCQAIVQKQEVTSATNIECITGWEDHFDEFIKLIQSARIKIEIFSWRLKFLPEDVFYALINAASRGVKIILTVNEVTKEVTRDTLKDLDIQINDDEPTHTKLMYVDDRVAVVGSYNFLGCVDDVIEDELAESSFKISGNTALVKKIRGRIYADLIRLKKNEEPILNHWKQDISDTSSIHILTNLGHHQLFFESALKDASQKVIIYAPFINGDNAKERLGLMTKLLKNNVSVSLYVLEDHIKSLYWALNHQHPSFKGRVSVHTTTAHRKTLIVDPDSKDNCYYSEGSFNWFSASTKLNDHARQETSIVVTGLRAGKLLDEARLEY